MHCSQRFVAVCKEGRARPAAAMRVNLRTRHGEGRVDEGIRDLPIAVGRKPRRA